MKALGGRFTWSVSSLVEALIVQGKGRLTRCLLLRATCVLATSWPCLTALAKVFVIIFICRRLSRPWCLAVRGDGCSNGWREHVLLLGWGRCWVRRSIGTGIVIIIFLYSHWMDSLLVDRLVEGCETALSASTALFSYDGHRTYGAQTAGGAC